MRLRHLIVAGLLALPWAATAAVVSERPASLRLTIYRDGDPAELVRTPAGLARKEGLAFISETRTIDVPAGESTIEFRNVASTIVPDTVEIGGLPDGLIEKNFDYDLLTPGSLLSKSVGESVTLVRTDAKSGKQMEQTAIVRSAPSGTMLEIDGRLEALKCSGLPEKLVFSKIPDGLKQSPTLSVRARAPVAGRYNVTLSYIATGLNWTADYVARIHPDGSALDLSGFITLSNFSDTGFERIPVDVIAGTVSQTGEDTPVDPAKRAASTSCWPAKIDWASYRRIVTAVNQQELAFPPPPSPPMASLSAETVVVTGSRVPAAVQFGDYKLYALPERETVAARQTKQLQFLDQKDVRFERVYSYLVNDWQDEDSVNGHANVFLRFQNRKSDGLGQPMPEGTVSVEETTAGGSGILSGQDRILDKPEGVPVEIYFAGAPDIRVSRRILHRETSISGQDRTARTSLEIAIENDKPVPIAFELSQALDQPGWRIVGEDFGHVVEARGATWHFPLAPGEVKLVHYVIERPQEQQGQVVD